MRHLADQHEVAVHPGAAVLQAEAVAIAFDDVLVHTDDASP